MKYSVKEILYYVFNRLPKTIIGKYFKHNLVYAHWGRGLNNFGDCLTPFILKYYGLTPVYVPSFHKSDIILAGSILQLIPRDYKGTIIGTGGSNIVYNFPNASIKAVRGILTLNNTINNNHDKIKLGDPGLLMSYIYHNDVSKDTLIGIIPHFVDKDDPAITTIHNRNKKSTTIINVLDSPPKVIKKIKSCKYILSSSLHGLIIADTFHIPNIRFTTKRNNANYKYDDYYSSLGIESTYIQLKGDESLQELISLTSLKPVDKIQSLKEDLNQIMISYALSVKNNLRSIF